MKPTSTPFRSKPATETLAAARPEAGDDEPALVGRSQGGDEEAFRCLVERYRDRAYGLALRILRVPAEAEEAAQDAFVRAWLALPRFRGEARFSTWLYRIVSRRALDRLSSMRQRLERESPIETLEGIPSGAQAPNDRDRERSRLIERLVAELPPAQRAAVTLFYYEGRSVRQVALALEMPEGTVKTHLSRARSALRQMWRRAEDLP